MNNTMETRKSVLFPSPYADMVANGTQKSMIVSKDMSSLAGNYVYFSDDSLVYGILKITGCKPYNNAFNLEFEITERFAMPKVADISELGEDNLCKVDFDIGQKEITKIVPDVRMDEEFENKFNSGIKYAIEKKYDGLRVVLSKNDGAIAVYSKGMNIMKNIPFLEEQIRGMLSVNFSVDACLVPLDDEGRQVGATGKTKLVESLNSGKVLEDNSIMAYAFDVLEYNNEAISSKSWEERKKILNSMQFGSNIHQVQSIVTINLSQMRGAVELISMIPGSNVSIAKRMGDCIGISEEWTGIESTLTPQEQRKIRDCVDSMMKSGKLTKLNPKTGKKYTKSDLFAICTSGVKE